MIEMTCKACGKELIPSNNSLTGYRHKYSMEAYWCGKDFRLDNSVPVENEPPNV